MRVAVTAAVGRELAQVFANAVVGEPQLGRDLLRDDRAVAVDVPVPAGARAAVVALDLANHVVGFIGRACGNDPLPLVPELAGARGERPAARATDPRRAGRHVLLLFPIPRQ